MHRKQVLLYSLDHQIGHAQKYACKMVVIYWNSISAHMYDKNKSHERSAEVSIVPIPAGLFSLTHSTPQSSSRFLDSSGWGCVQIVMFTIFILLQVQSRWLYTKLQPAINVKVVGILMICHTSHPNIE